MFLWGEYKGTLWEVYTQFMGVLIVQLDYNLDISEASLYPARELWEEIKDYCVDSSQIW